MRQVQRQIFYGLLGKFLFRLRYLFMPPVYAQHMVDLRLDTKHGDATLKRMRLHGLAILLLFLSTSTAKGDAILESASRIVSAGSKAVSSTTFGVFNQSVSDSVAVCDPLGCFGPSGAASASQMSDLQPLVFSGNGQAGSAGEAPLAGASTLDLSFTLLTPH